MSVTAREKGGSGGGSPRLVTTSLSESGVAAAGPVNRQGALAVGPGASGAGRGLSRPAEQPLPRPLPRYVYACREKRWHVKTWAWDPTTGEIVQERTHPFRCRSWRHEGDCRRWRAAQNFSRVNTALLHFPARDCLFLVLTLDRGAWERQGKTRYDAFRELRERWRSLAKALQRRWGGYEYVSTVEVHRSGWPHLNVLLVSRWLAREARHRREGEGAVKSGPAHDWLREHAIACGFGQQCSIERAGSRRALAGYVVKVAGSVEAAHAGAQVGEVVKMSQVPEGAPPHFRRLRSSIRFLPKPYVYENVSGKLVQSPDPSSYAGELAARMTREPGGRASDVPPPPPTGPPERPRTPDSAEVRLGRRVVVAQLRVRAGDLYRARAARTALGRPDGWTAPEARLLDALMRLEFEVHTDADRP